MENAFIFPKLEALESGCSAQHRWAPDTAALVTKFPLTLDTLLTTQETKAALTGTSDEPTSCARGSLRQGAALESECPEISWAE